ncbi:MAG: adenine deaminase [Chloroflexi bacterium]|nr:adenine deaminase [Chloroflexota bacterium]
MRDLIAVARGEAPADLVLKNARIINTFTGEIEKASVAVHQDRIAGVGDYRQGKEVLDLEGSYLCPGLIDGHVHPESSYLHPAQYAMAVVPRGTTAIVTDLHEIANVAGLEGLRFFLRWSKRLPLDLFLLAPSCVPATPLETAGASLGPQEIKRALGWKGVVGLGEMMNFPGVLAGDSHVLEKLSAARGKVRDGHAPGLGGKDLNAYIASGISSDHETTTYEEGQEKLRRGMWLMLREGSSEKNLEALLPLVTDKTYHRCLLVVDDRTCGDILREGDMDAVVRRAIALGLDPVRAIALATLNPARRFGLEGYGAVAPGYIANLIAVRDLKEFRVDLIFHHGRLVAREGRPLFSSRPRHALASTMKVRSFSREDLKLPAARAPLPVIQVIPGQILTRKAHLPLKIERGEVVPDPQRDILKAVVVERHRATGNIGLGLVRGFGLREGALASSVAHDSHNIVAVGAGDADLYAAIQEIIRLGGGLVVTRGGKALASLPLPIAGLLSDLPLEEVVARLERLQALARGLGCPLPSPFATLSFIALPVIPELRLTDKGLVDVDSFRVID